MTRSLPETQDRLSLQQPLDDPLDSHLLITNNQASSGKHSELLLFLRYFQESCSRSPLSKPSFLWSHLFLTLSFTQHACFSVSFHTQGSYSYICLSTPMGKLLISFSLISL